MSSKDISRVTVLKGGFSAEREVSLSSGGEVEAALRAVGFEVTGLDAGPDLMAALDETAPDVVFNALHGRWGEDGRVQGVLEWMRLPYTHSGVYASALAMDKEKTRELYQSYHLPVAEGAIYDLHEVSARHVMKPPYVVKPNNEGSSVGISLVLEGAGEVPILANDMPARVLVEEYIPGRELTVAVMGERALGVTDILTDQWYDYGAKYSRGGSRHVVPADIPNEIYERLLDYALTAHQVLGCRGLSRTDFRWDEEKGLSGIYLLETNTQPGMTPTSLAPEQAAHQGISFPDLCEWLVKDASCDR